MDDLEGIGDGVVEAEALPEALGKESETTRNEEQLDAVLPARGKQNVRPGSQLQPLLVDALQGRLLQAGEQRDAAAQALRILDLAAHRLRGDGCDLGSLACQIAQLVDALDGDQRRVHVHPEQLHTGEAPPLRDPCMVALARLAPVFDGRRQLDLPQAIGVLAEPVNRTGLNGRGELLRLLRRESRALYDKVQAASCCKMSRTAWARSCQAGSFASTRSLSGPARRALRCTRMNSITFQLSSGGSLMNCSCTASWVASTRAMPSGRAAMRTWWHASRARAASGSSPKRSTSSSRSRSSPSPESASASRL